VPLSGVCWRHVSGLNGEGERASGVFLVLAAVRTAPTMRARLRSAVRECDRVRRLAPATAVGAGGRRAGRCGSAGRRGGRPHQAAPRRRVLAGGRNCAGIGRGHAECGAGGILAPGPGRVRINRLPAAGALGPAACRLSPQDAGRGIKLRRVAPGGAVSRPLPGLRDPGLVVTSPAAGPGAGSTFGPGCSRSRASLRAGFRQAARLAVR